MLMISTCVIAFHGVPQFYLTQCVVKRALSQLIIHLYYTESV